MGGWRAGRHGGRVRIEFPSSNLASVPLLRSVRSAIHGR